MGAAKGKAASAAAGGGEGEGSGAGDGTDAAMARFRLRAARRGLDLCFMGCSPEHVQGFPAGGHRYCQSLCHSIYLFAVHHAFYFR
jgi:hypothetical protein